MSFLGQLAPALPGFGRTTITVTAPLCAPDRSFMESRVRKQLGFYDFQKPSITATEMKEGKMPMYWKIDVTVNEQAANWCEYNLLRWGYERFGPYLNPANARNARKYLGVDCPKGWYEPGCKNAPAGARIAGLSEIEANPPLPWKISDKARPRQQKKRQPRGFLDILKDLL
jgi:hypothetical protein